MNRVYLSAATSRPNTAAINALVTAGRGGPLIPVDTGMGPAILAPVNVTRPTDANNPTGETFIQKYKTPLIIGGILLLGIGVAVMVSKTKKKRRSSLGRRRKTTRRRR